MNIRKYEVNIEKLSYSIKRIKNNSFLFQNICVSYLAHCKRIIQYIDAIK